MIVYNSASSSQRRRRDTTPDPEGPPPVPPCRFPSCDCGGLKVYRGARQIALRLWGDPALYRRVFTTKRLPVYRIGSVLHMRECTVNAWIAEMERKSRGR